MPGSAKSTRARRSALPGLIGTALLRFVQDGCPNLSAAIAFYALLSFIPLAFLLLWGLGHLAPTDAGAMKAIEEQARAYIPTLRPEMLREAQRLLAASRRLGPAAILSMSALAILMMDAVQYALDRVLLPQGRRPYIRSKLFSLLTVLLLGLAAGASLVLSAALTLAGQVKEWALRHSLPAMARVIDPLYSAAEGLLVGWVLPVGLMAFAFTMAYRALTHVRVPWRYAAAAGAVVTVLFELAKAGFHIYITRFARTNLIYGSFGSLIVMLLWIYYSANVFLYGAELLKGMMEKRMLGRWDG